MSETSSGGFDRRTLLAFGLMILVWIAFTQFFMPKQRPEERSAASLADTTTAVPPAPAGDTRDRAPDAGTPALAAAAGPAWRLVNELPAEDREIVFEGERFRAVFHTRGAQLRSWKLHGFTDAHKELVDLVTPGSGALQLLVDGPDGTIALDETVFSLEETDAGANGEHVLRFVAEGPLARADGDSAGAVRARVERIYRLDQARYDFGMDVVVAGIPNPRLDQRLVLAWDDGIPNLETQRGLELRAKAAVAQLAAEFVKDGYGGSGFGCQCGSGRASRGGQRTYDGMLRWAGVRGKYFAGIIVPEVQQQATFIAHSDPQVGLVGMRVALPMAHEGESRQRFTVFAGPIDYRVLRELDGRLGTTAARLVEHGGSLIAPISKATHWFLITVKKVVPNYGLVIILLAVVVRILFHPLNAKAMESQRKLQALKPLLDEINAKYKDNPEQRTKKTMELHKQQGVNPLGGCLPLLVQMPVIYALYNVLMNSIELRKAPFAFWVNDLSAPDSVGHVLGVPINILPLLMAVTMFWQQKLTPSDPRQAPMLVLMPLLMVFFFYGLPSGLVLYWTVTNVLALVQQMRMKPITLAVPVDLADTGRKAPLFGAGRKGQE
jgi:YidC/Oxa1 family membrane protein insertase